MITLNNFTKLDGSIFPSVDTTGSSVRPAFQIDLSKVEWVRY